MSSLRPRVSVVVPYRDAARFLGEAIESVVGQAFDSWELLLVDDGSRDDGPALASSWAERDRRVRCLAQPDRINRGIAATRALGAAAARGELLAQLDADDVWLPHKLERQLDWLARHPSAAMVYSPSLAWFGWSGRASDRARDQPYDLGPLAGRLIEPPGPQLEFASERWTTPCPSSFLLRRGVWDTVGGSSDPWLGRCDVFEDQVLLAKVHVAHPVYVGDEVLDRYRRRDESVYATALREGDHRRERARYLAWLERYLAAREPVPGALSGWVGRVRDDLSARPAVRPR